MPDYIHCPKCDAIVGEWRGHLVHVKHEGRQITGLFRELVCCRTRQRTPCGGVWLNPRWERGLLAEVQTLREVVTA